MCYKRAACSAILCQQAGIVNILVRRFFFLNLLRYAISFSAPHTNVGRKLGKKKWLKFIASQSGIVT